MVRLFASMALHWKVAMQKRKPAFCIGWDPPSDSDRETQDISQMFALGIAAVHHIRHDPRRREYLISR